MGANHARHATVENTKAVKSVNLFTMLTPPQMRIRQVYRPYNQSSALTSKERHVELRAEASRES